MEKSNVDKIFQSAVDEETKRLFSCSIGELLDRNDYGSIDTISQGIKINIGWWKWERNENCYHVVLKAQRKLFLNFYKQYLNGIKFDVESGVIEYLSNEEVGDYD